MKKDKIIGITFGSFDLCHYGHALMFEECKEYCDYLIVGVQSDPSIDRPEKNKPVQSHEERIGIVSSLKFVDEVVSYDTEADLIEVLKNIQPHPARLRFLLDERHPPSDEIRSRDC